MFILGHKKRKTKKRTNLHKISAPADMRGNFSNEIFKLRRKDLEFDEFIQRKQSNSSESLF